MRHRACVLHPRAYGLTPYRVVYKRAESHPVRSLLDEGLWYRHPERKEAAIVWTQDAASLAVVLTYHSRDSGRHLRVLTA